MTKPTVKALLHEFEKDEDTTRKYGDDVWCKEKINALKEYRSMYKRYNRYEVTQCIIKDYSGEEQVEEIAEGIKRVKEYIEKQYSCKKGHELYECKKLEYPFLCNNEIKKKGKARTCSEYKELHRFVAELYDRIQIEALRRAEINKIDPKIETGKAFLDNSVQKLNKANEDATQRIIKLVDIQNEITNEKEKLVKEQEKLVKEQKRLVKKQEDFKDTTKGVYLQVISLLAIFTALVVAIFGGLYVMDNIAGAFQAGEFTLYKTLFAGSLTILFICNLIFLLLSLVAAIYMDFKNSDRKRFYKYCVIVIIIINVLALSGIAVGIIEGR